MRLRILAAVLALLVSPAALAATSLSVLLVAPRANPRVNVKWFYSIVVADLEGKPLPATVTAQILDPFGGVHPVDYGPTQKPIVGFRFKGTFRDYIEFPPESRGITLTIRWTVRAKAAKRVLTRRVVPRR